MSTAGPPGPLSPVQPARRQLDELDALIQQMLALPVNTLPEFSAEDPSPILQNPPVDDSVQASFQAWDKPAHEATTEQPGEAAFTEANPSRNGGLQPEIPFADLSVPLPRASLESLKYPNGVSSTRQREETSEVATTDGESCSHFQFQSPLPKRTVQTQVGYQDTEAEVPAWQTPAVVVNRAFDACTILLGPLGRWLRSSEGRAFLGGVGLLMLGAALFWGVLDWAGLSW